MIQIIKKIGKLSIITLPKEFVKKHNLKAGDKLYVDKFEDRITISTKPNNTNEIVSDAELSAALEEVEKRYGRALQKLADL